MGRQLRCHSRSFQINYCCFDCFRYLVRGWVWIDTNVLPSDSNETAAQARGLFGDKFGAVNSLFSGLAFAGIILTLMLQRKELSISRKEVGRQQFDNTFFNLLKLHVDITSKISLYGDDGRKAFSALYFLIKDSNEYFPAFLALQKMTKEKIRALKDKPEIDQTRHPELSASDVSNLTAVLAGGVRVIDFFLDEDIKMHERIASEAISKVAEKINR
ncbi:MAG: hypothetical protein NVV73_05335 [Cellvibrionaceae bacterium]|nr:hypothetical protein [Cellvibrionaceae bacterium]